MIVRTNGGLLDVGRAIGSNMSIGALTSLPENAGNLVDPGSHFPIAMSSQYPDTLPWGEWFEIDPTTVRLERVFPFVFRPWWKLPDGSEVKLEDSYSKVTTLAGIFAWSVTSARVKLVAETLRGLQATGHVRGNIDPADLPDNGRDDGATIPDAVVAGSSALIIVAIIGAAIWFLPKNLAR